MRSDTEDEEAGDITSGAFFSMLEEELDKGSFFFFSFLFLSLMIKHDLPSLLLSNIAHISST